MRSWPLLHAFSAALRSPARAWESDELAVGVRRRLLVDDELHVPDGVARISRVALGRGQVLQQPDPFAAAEARILQMPECRPQVPQALFLAPDVARGQGPLQVEARQGRRVVAGRRLGVGLGDLLPGLLGVDQFLLVEDRGDVLDGARRRHESRALERAGDLLGFLDRYRGLAGRHEERRPHDDEPSTVPRGGLRKIVHCQASRTRRLDVQAQL